MARVYCIEWSEDDESGATRNVGWSLHLSRTQAASYARTHEPRYGRHAPARCVDVPGEVHEAVLATHHGMFWATPMACPFPAVAEPDLERERELASARDHAPDDVADVVGDQERPAPVHRHANGPAAGVAVVKES